jgi:pyruvate dehydrogenase E1 component alpha subunit
VSLQRQGRFGTYAQMEGQEASLIASTYPLQPQDWMVTTYRETGAMWRHGVPLKSLSLYWMGNEFGSHMPEGVRVLPISIPVGSHPLHAVGLAYAGKYRRDNSIAITYFGDGATSEGDVHEAMNMAGVLQLPCVFLCQNNQYAISVPIREQTASATIAQKAVAYGFPGVRVDGNDIFAVYAAVEEAVARARRGEGPTLIEAYTYRLGPHTTADDPTKYRQDSSMAVSLSSSRQASATALAPDRVTARRAAFTLGIADGAIERSRTPRPTRRRAWRGWAAISPHTETGRVEPAVRSTWWIVRTTAGCRGW